MTTLAFLAVFTWTSLWLTPDQEGQRLLARGEFVAAAQAFRDPLWQGVAWFRAGDFNKAAQAFARRDTPEANFNQGNAWLMRGKYETAIACYDHALEQRADWKEAQENRALAAARAEMTAQTGGDMGDQKIGADKVVFDKNQAAAGEDTEVTGGQVGSSDAVQAMWLRRVQTRPADFLRVKFASQLEQENGGAK